MDCNKDDAARALDIAQVKFSQHDFAAAKRFASKAYKLFPELEGLSKFLPVLDVHMRSQERTSGGEIDCYNILKVDRMADEATIRKQYRKLALFLHPDKNKSVGAESAFKYISEAWGVLSDKVRKAKYDSKLRSCVSLGSMIGKPNPSPPVNPHSVPKPPPQHFQATPSKPSTGGRPATGKSKGTWTEMNPQSQSPTLLSAQTQANAPAPTVPSPLSTATSTFTATATATAMATAMAIPVPPPAPAVAPAPAPAPASSTSTFRPLSGSSYNSPGVNSYWTTCPSCKMQLQYPSIYKDKYLCCAVCLEPFSATETMYIHGVTIWSINVSCVDDIDKMEHDSQATAFSSLFSESLSYGTAQMKAESMNGLDMKMRGHVKAKDARKRPTKKADAVRRFKEDFNDDVSMPSIKNMYENSQADGGNQIGCQAMHTSAAKKPKMDGNGHKNTQGKCKNEHRNDGASEPSGRRSRLTVESTIKENQNLNSATKSINEVPAVIHVPDSDFYDFDQDRTEEHFCIDQIWAVYDDEDALPRYYGQVSIVYSQRPFKVQLTWLETISALPNASLNCDNPYPTCGQFKLGKTMIAGSVNMFSHIITPRRAANGEFEIYPRKGDVWSVFKGDVEQELDVAEVLTDYSHEVGVKICMLEKVKGFKSVFQRNGQEMWVNPSQLRTFSHHVLVRRFTETVPGITQEGCLELDPACLPSLLHG